MYHEVSLKKCALQNFNQIQWKTAHLRLPLHRSSVIPPFCEKVDQRERARYITTEAGTLIAINTEKVSIYPRG